MFRQPGHSRTSGSSYGCKHSPTTRVWVESALLRRFLQALHLGSNLTDGPTEAFSSGGDTALLELLEDDDEAIGYAVSTQTCLAYKYKVCETSLSQLSSSLNMLLAWCKHGIMPGRLDTNVRQPDFVRHSLLSTVSVANSCIQGSSIVSASGLPCWQNKYFFLRPCSAQILPTALLGLAWGGQEMASRTMS